MSNENNDPQAKVRMTEAIRHDILLDRSSVDTDIKILYDAVVAKVSNSIYYYQDRKRSKRQFAQCIRFVSIILFSFAGLVPLLDATGVFNSNPKNWLTAIDSGQIGLLLAGTAAALIGMDKFFGLSSSWARFVSAELGLQRIRDRFQLNWALANASLSENDEERISPINRLQLLTQFSMEISQIDEDETRVWISEYQNSLAVLEKRTGEQRDAMQPGTIHVSIERGEKISGIVRILLDGSPVQSTRGDTVAIRQVNPGTHEIQATGAGDTGVELASSQLVTVAGGATAPVLLKLG